jgi:hypothetical protein
MDRTASTLSRRNILLGLAGAAVSAVVATTALAPAAGERTRRVLAGNRFTRRFLSLADAGQSEWTSQVGSAFTLDGGYRLRLAGVRPLHSQGARPASVARDRAFAAVFEVLGGAPLAEDLIYSARHAHYGALPLFLTGTDDPRRMLAVFN